LRLPRDHYVRWDSNDYSVQHSAVGRRVLVRADLDRVRVWCEAGLGRRPYTDLGAASNHLRSHPVKAAQMLRQQRLAVVPPAAKTEMEQRRLADSDSALGVADGGMAC
jgi:hypothetical protein